MGTSGFSRVALIGALAAALALGACGRKGMLEPPPSANAVPSEQPSQQVAQPSLGQEVRPGFEDARNNQEQPLPPSKRTFILDGIL